ncbi:hypothetical protein TNCV_1673311 [Trichonephila clavipes]|nr:hypothetical protein TNCV_1673311 [Trichonephila clavipes]
MTPHKPRKSAPIEKSVDEEDMILCDREEEVESLKNRNYLGEMKKNTYFLSEEYWQNEAKRIPTIWDRYNFRTVYKKVTTVRSEQSIQRIFANWHQHPAPPCNDEGIQQVYTL